MNVTSSAFGQGENIPTKYSCDGQNVSPPLQWSGAPPTTQSYAIIVDDPDAPRGTFTHWVGYDISASRTSLPEGINSAGKSGKNGAGGSGYTGPCPPNGTHRYFFRVYALDIPSLNLSEGASKDQVINTMQGHIVGQGELMGKYSR